MQQYISKYFACSPPPLPSIGQNSTFSEHGHVAYQIDPRPVPDPLGGLKGWDQKVKIQFFQNMVMLHIKLKGITDAATR